MPQPNETFTACQVRLRRERTQKDAAARKKHWTELLKQLRLANPSQKIVYEGAHDGQRDLVVDGTRFHIQLDEQKSGCAGDWNRIGRGVYYFVIGDWRRGGNRPRANQKKAGFDWAQIAQLVEGERRRLVAAEDREAQQEATLAASAKALDKLFKRKPRLEDMRSQIDVSPSTGLFSYTVRGMGVDALERVLDIARAIDNMNGDEPVGDES